MLGCCWTTLHYRVLWQAQRCRRHAPHRWICLAARAVPAAMWYGWRRRWPAGMPIRCSSTASTPNTTYFTQTGRQPHWEQVWPSPACARPTRRLAARGGTRSTTPSPGTARSPPRWPNGRPSLGGRGHQTDGGARPRRPGSGSPRRGTARLIADAKATSGCRRRGRRGDRLRRDRRASGRGSRIDLRRRRVGLRAHAPRCEMSTR